MPGYVIDAYGNPVSPTQQTYISEIIGSGYGGRSLVTSTNPYYNPNAGAQGSTQSITQTTTINDATSVTQNYTYSQVPLAPQYHVTFDTIGQTIYRSIGHAALPLRPIWYGAIIDSGDATVGSTMDFAAAICAPIDPTEDGTITGIMLGGSTLIYDPATGANAGIIVPPNTDPTVAELMIASITNAIIYPGDEAQDPCPLIVADKGAAVTNAFRGIRYIVFPNWPLSIGLPSSLSLLFRRSNTITTTLSRPITPYIPPPPAVQGGFRVILDPDGYWQTTTYCHPPDINCTWCYLGGLWRAGGCGLPGQVQGTGGYTSWGWRGPTTFLGCTYSDHGCLGGQYDILPVYYTAAGINGPCIACSLGWADNCCWTRSDWVNNSPTGSKTVDWKSRPDASSMVVGGTNWPGG